MPWVNSLARAGAPPAFTALCSRDPQLLAQVLLLLAAPRGLGTFEAQSCEIFNIRGLSQHHWHCHATALVLVQHHATALTFDSHVTFRLASESGDFGDSE